MIGARRPEIENLKSFRIKKMIVSIYGELGDSPTNPADNLREINEAGRSDWMSGPYLRDGSREYEDLGRRFKIFQNLYIIRDFKILIIHRISYANLYIYYLIIDFSVIDFLK